MPCILRNKHHKFSHKGFQPGSPSAYIFALACFATAAMTSFAFSRIVENVTESIAFYPAIFIAALFGGARAGGLAAICSALTLWWTDIDFLGDGNSLRTQSINLGLYIISTSLVIWVPKLLRRASNHDRRPTE